MRGIKPASTAALEITAASRAGVVGVHGRLIIVQTFTV
jgi:hypothetical protein